MAEDIPVTGPGGTPPRPAYEGAYPGYVPGYQVLPPAAVRRVSWGAIFAGAIVALMVQLLLGTLGLAVMLASIDPATEAQTLQGMGVGTGIWLALTALLSLFFGGWVAGRLSAHPRRFDGVMHGIVSWGLVTLFSTWLAATFLTNVVQGAFGLVGSTLGFVGDTVTAQAGAAQAGEGDVGNRIEEFLRQTGDPQLQPDALRERADVAGEEAQEAAAGAAGEGNAFDSISAAFNRLAAQGQAAVSEVDRQDAINVLVARTDMSEAQAGQVVDSWIRTFGQGNVQQTAAQVTENVTNALGKFLAWSFVAMGLGLLAAAVGGALGAPKNIPLGVPATTPAREH